MGYLNKVIIGTGGAVTSVNARVGDVVLSQADVGLTNVQDTADLDKPISTAAQTKLDLKVDKIAGYSLLADTAIADLTLPRWDDLVFGLVQSVRDETLKPDYDFTNIGLLFPRNNVNEIAYLTFQMPHAWKQGTTIFPHIHVIQSANQQAVFNIDYKWYNLGDTVPALWTTYTMNQYAFVYASGSSSQIIKNPVGISGVGKTISSILKIKLYRNDNVYVGDMLADQFDIHIEKDGFGSQSELSKT